MELDCCRFGVLELECCGAGVLEPDLKLLSFAC